MRNNNRLKYFVRMGLPLLILIVTQQSCSDTVANKKPGTSVMTKKPISNNATNSRTQYADINGRKIAYRSIGDGEPMILCQRFRGMLDDWDPLFLDELAKHYNVITFNYTGFASSTGAPHTDMMGFASDVTDLANALHLKKVIIGGWSFGGWVAQIVTTEFPDLVSQTILIGTRPPGKVNHDFEDIFKKTAYKLVNDFEDEIILFFEPISELSKKLAKESHDRIAMRTLDRDPLVKLDQLQFYGKGGESFTKDSCHAREKLTTTKTPILVISGDHEICFPPENWFELNRKLPTTQVVIIPRAGHGPQHQYPGMIAEYIHSFIENNKKIGTVNRS
ncbi:MAG TPA: alpha/beta hydrolase [Chitinophagaceae bacterium]|nr:alpha/beta hydrolase [Chitinophagaceae bacterium]